MAIVPSSKYPGQIDTSDSSAYPQGKAQNVTTAGDGSGTPLEQDWVNDLWGFLQSLLSRANITPSGSPDEVGASDYLDAVDTVATENVYDVLRFDAAFVNQLTLGTSVALSGGNSSALSYLPVSGKWWYASNSAGTASYVHDSSNGTTWSSATTIDPGAPQGVTLPTEDANDYVYVGTEDEIYRSTTNLASGMTSQSASFANITRQEALLYDSNYSKFYAAGNGFTESATPGAFPTFSAIQTVANVSDLATDNNGTLVAVTVGTSVWVSTNGTSFTQNVSTAPTGGFHQVFWNSALSQWVAIGGAANDEVWFTDTPSGSWYEHFSEAYNIINLPEGVLVLNAPSATTDPGAMLLVHKTDDNGGIAYRKVGAFSSNDGISSDIILDASAHKYQGGGGVAVWTRDANDYVTTLEYGT